MPAPKGPGKFVLGMVLILAGVGLIAYNIAYPASQRHYSDLGDVRLCSEDSKTADGCPDVALPVCGSDNRDYQNPCSACREPDVLFYVEGTCAEAVEP